MPAGDLRARPDAARRVGPDRSRELGKFVADRDEFANVDWRTDDAGHIDDSSVALATIQPQPIPTALKDCITETVVDSEFAWKPARKYKELVPIGTPPPPTDGAG